MPAVSVRTWCLCATLAASCASGAAAQTVAPPAAPAQAAPSKDSLGRDTPRGTVLGFISAARNGRDEVAPLYLNTRLRGAAAVDLAHKLFVVLDSRLPPRLNELSDRPEGSLGNPLKPDRDAIGTVSTSSGPLEVVVERVNAGAAQPVWLFSRATLDAIPAAYDEINLVSIERYLPRFLTENRIAGVRLFEWLVLILVLPVSYRLTDLLSRLIGSLFGMWRRRRGRPLVARPGVHGAIRLFLLAAFIRWLVSIFELPLLERQFWSAIVVTLVIGAGVWALLVLNAHAEQYVFRRVHGAGHGEVAAMLRLGRRVGDVIVIAVGILVTMHFFGFDPTAALAGLGIGGIAIALAAQKTLENVVGGVSIIFDQAVRVGDFIKLGDTVGAVDYIGLRSTRIRTLDRTILSVPNGQIANVNIETLSARDKFWFHHFVGLRYETTSAQMRAVAQSIRQYLGAHPMIDRKDSIRVRFFRFGQCSLDIEVFAYVFAPDWEAFLETQQELLLDIMEVIERAGAMIALPTQTLHLFEARNGTGADSSIAASTVARLASPHQAAASA